MASAIELRGLEASTPRGAESSEQVQRVTGELSSKNRSPPVDGAPAMECPVSWSFPERVASNSNGATLSALIRDFGGKLINATRPRDGKKSCPTTRIEIVNSEPYRTRLCRHFLRVSCLGRQANAKQGLVK
jgi:hypothetical protein